MGAGGGARNRGGVAEGLVAAAQEGSGAGGRGRAAARAAAARVKAAWAAKGLVPPAWGGRRGEAGGGEGGGGVGAEGLVVAVWAAAASVGAAWAEAEFWAAARVAAARGDGGQGGMVAGEAGAHCGHRSKVSKGRAPYETKRAPRWLKISGRGSGGRVLPRRPLGHPE